jgi:hypothetical protein
MCWGAVPWVGPQDERYSDRADEFADQAVSLLDKSASLMENLDNVFSNVYTRGVTNQFF